MVGKRGAHRTMFAKDQGTVPDNDPTISPFQSSPPFPPLPLFPLILEPRHPTRPGLPPLDC
jgi:hypothetical protein